LPEQALSDAQLQKFYREHGELNPNPAWRARYEEAIATYQRLSVAEFASPANQESLWRERRITPVGPGEAVQTQGAYTDSEVISALEALRTRSWPVETKGRAAEMQAEFDRLLTLVADRHSGSRPRAKLGRVFAALVPSETNSCLNWKSNKRVVELVLGAVGPIPFPASAVRVRARLREVLGEEADLTEGVRRATFCWWLQANAEQLLAGVVPPRDEGGREVEPVEPVETVTLWSANKQLRGIGAIGGYVETYRAVVRAAEGGATPDDIASTLEADTEGLSLRSCRSLFNRVRRFGFLENRDGLWFPSEEGQEFVEDDPAEVFVEKLMVRIFGPAHLLRLLKEGSLQKQEVYSAMCEIYPSWTSNMMPSSIGAWARSLDLVRVEDSGNLALTEYGVSWEARLPDDLPVPTALSITDDEVMTVDRERVEWPTLEKVEHAIVSDSILKDFVFAAGQLEALHRAWNFHKTKRFVILSGLSGTGKTALLLHYARVFCELLDLDPDVHRSVVAVSPDWTDPSGLLGYMNALSADPDFHAEDALRLVIEATRAPHLPFFLILDEMNLARVERYLAPFLSSMESGEDLVLHTQEEAINGIPPRVKWPKNLFIGGTVNMDETTHPFSDKVLDRAFTLEFWDVDLPEFFERKAASTNGPRLLEVEALLTDVNAALRKIRRHFGYRTAGEVLDFLTVEGSVESVNWPLVDQAVFSKVLPRVRGEESPDLLGAMEGLRKIFDDRSMSVCLGKLDEMKARLISTGVTRYWS